LLLANANPPPKPSEKPNDDEKTDSEDGSMVDHAATFPAGTRELEGEAHAHEKKEEPVPFWLKGRSDADITPPYLTATEVQDV